MPVSLPGAVVVGEGAAAALSPPTSTSTSTLHSRLAASPDSLSELVLEGSLGGGAAAALEGAAGAQSRRKLALWGGTSETAVAGLMTRAKGADVTLPARMAWGGSEVVVSPGFER